ncbi:PIN domain-containing protein [Gloeobacter violaceus]|uniref:Gll1696 protein n=1 Tax=Gloeobacter violaceus (strain ATCC 29082 / PCC 7421) TaxID=251221 RepID=Q7NJY5_GLOVI|nr:PIN domain-containing protein [Gloeobacter violaceus]BAC89637.1 gll1696 [Gloeobacter violaceus PCC 7421]
MNAKVFLDTNILVYVYDPFDAAKQARSIAIVDGLVRTARAVVSTQVLGEFIAATTRTRRQLLSAEEAIERVRRYLSTFEVVDVTPFVVLEALRGVEMHRFEFWDAQIWAAARLNQIPSVYSEDFNPSSTIEGVLFTNPLSADFRLQ